MSRTLPVLALAAAVALAAVPVQSAVILDTGAATPIAVAPVLSSTQWIAARFDVTGPTVVTDVEGYLLSFIEAGGDLTFALRRDAAGPGDELYSASGMGFAAEGWRGLHGLDWRLAAGTYWLSFEVRSGQTFDGVIALPAHPMTFAYAQPPPGPWYVFSDALGAAARVGGEAVPEPGAWALMILGFGISGAALRRRRPLLGS